MRTALIGHTGFVGSNLASSHRFDDVYNTANIAEIEGREYDLVVYGATSFVGQILCRYLTRRHGAVGKLRWAIAGRDLAKLDEVSRLEEEAAAADKAGMPAELTRELPLPYSLPARMMSGVPSAA